MNRKVKQIKKQTETISTAERKLPEKNKISGTCRMIAKSKIWVILFPKKRSREGLKSTGRNND